MRLRYYFIQDERFHVKYFAIGILRQYISIATVNASYSLLNRHTTEIRLQKARTEMLRLTNV